MRNFWRNCLSFIYKNKTKGWNKQNGEPDDDFEARLAYNWRSVQLPFLGTPKVLFVA